MGLLESIVEPQTTLFPKLTIPTSTDDVLSPEGYTGLAGFHKYWGKKPVEGLSFLIESLTEENDIVLDPFLGSGLIAWESLSRNRRFIGIDINPFSIEHASLLLSLPSFHEYSKAVLEIENNISKKINDSYRTSNDQTASHFLWEENEIVSVWIKSKGRNRIENTPNDQDLFLFNKFKNYEPKYFRKPIFFKNSRINADPAMTVRDIFTGRAIRNMDLIIEEILKYPSHLKRALYLTLTSSSGQMSNMVFAIKNRSNRIGTDKEGKIEVGSWVIGFWCPKNHFEINVWNCFRNRSNKLMKILPERRREINLSKDPLSLLKSKSYVCLINSDCREALRKIPSETVSFICTDPPHSDRVPYLELSELWNAILNLNADFENEIVVSNAKERNKSKIIYNVEMSDFMNEAARVLKYGGFIAVYFNARDEKSWKYLKSIENSSGELKFIGSFPMVYSATSVVQDNRDGAMKQDYVLLYQKKKEFENYKPVDVFMHLPNWSLSFPNK